MLIIVQIFIISVIDMAFGGPCLLIWVQNAHAFLRFRFHLCDFVSPEQKVSWQHKRHGTNDGVGSSRYWACHLHIPFRCLVAEQLAGRKCGISDAYGSACDWPAVCEPLAKASLELPVILTIAGQISVLLHCSHLLEPKVIPCSDGAMRWVGNSIVLNVRTNGDINYRKYKAFLVRQGHTTV
jgi:hypothetical protein